MLYMWCRNTFQTSYVSLQVSLFIAFCEFLIFLLFSLFDYRWINIWCCFILHASQHVIHVVQKDIRDFIIHVSLDVIDVVQKVRPCSGSSWCNSHYWASQLSPHLHCPAPATTTTTTTTATTTTTTDICAKFHQNRLKIATVRVQTDRQMTDRHTNTNIWNLTQKKPFIRGSISNKGIPYFYPKLAPT